MDGDHPHFELAGSLRPDRVVHLLVAVLHEVKVVLDVDLGEVDDPLALLVGADAVELAVAGSDMDTHAGQWLAVLVDHVTRPAPVTGRDRRTRSVEAKGRAFRGRCGEAR